MLGSGPSGQQYIILRDEPNCIWPTCTILTAPVDLQNQVAHSLTTLFLLSYTTSWTTFFSDFLALVQKNGTDGKTFDPFTAQMFLRVLAMIDEEVADTIYSSAKKDRNQQLNMEIKDRIRIFDVANIFRSLLEMMYAFEADPAQDALIRQGLSVIGQWIGIPLSLYA